MPDITDIERIRRLRIMRDKMDTGPSEPCGRCGGATWYRDIDPGVWYCFLCGNTAYLTDGTYRQRGKACNATQGSTQA